MNKVFAVLLVVGAFLVSFAALSLLEAWVLMITLGILWGEFHWLAPIGLLPAFGLATLGLGTIGMIGRTWRSDIQSYQSIVNAVTPKKVQKESVWN